MSYILVKDANDNLIAFGLNDGNYEPVIESGQKRVIEEDDVALPLINEFLAKLEENQNALKNKKDALLERLGITEDEAKLLLA
jgi:hypothetical protein